TVLPGCEAAGMTGDNHGMTVVLMRVSFGVLVRVNQAAMIEQRPVALGYGLQLGDQVRELLDVPAADITHNPLAFDTVRARRLAIGVSVVVVPRRGVPKPREAGQPLSLGQHVGGDTGL